MRFRIGVHVGDLTEKADGTVYGDGGLQLRRRRLAAWCCALAMVLGAFMLFADGAYAQANACDQLKVTLAARIDPGIRGYTLEAVPASAPVPPGAKAIGTCEGGARKILLRRGGAAQSSSGGASAAEPASAPQVIAAPAERAPRRPEVQRERPLQAVPAVPSPAPEVETSQAAASAGGVEVVRAIDRPAAPPAQVRLDESPVARVPLGQAFEWVGRHWHWMLALLLVLALAGPVWAWVAHRRAYDEAGLPRGPRLD